MGLLTKQMSPSELAPVCRQLATAYKAGIPILRTLEMAGREAPNSRAREVLKAMREDIQDGSTLAEAAKRQHPYLPPMFVELLANGEQGGRLDAMLGDLATYYEDRNALRRQIVTMTIYPALQLAIAWFVGTFAFMLLGQLSATLEGGGVAFDFASLMEAYLRFQARAAIILALAIGVLILVSRAGLLRWPWGWVRTHVWPLSPVTRRFALARFCRGFSLLVGSGVNIVQALRGAAAAASNPYIERDLLEAVPPVQSGAPLTEAFRRCKYLDRTTREMIAVGEASGELEASLRKASEYYFDQATNATQVMLRVGFVLTIVFVAAIVGYVVISFYAQLYGGALDNIGM
ncbi:MAG: type II secretion system F family protein [Candidatus Hydrogenedentota bacterium]